MIVSVPGVIAVSKPVPVIVALTLVVLHTPPVAASEKAATVPVHIKEGPEITPATGIGFTVMV
jgi:hypothetical protein